MLLVTDNLAERLLNRRKTESFGALTLRREFMKTLLHSTLMMAAFSTAIRFIRHLH